MQEDDQLSGSEYRLSTSFHRTFSLNRESIKLILELAIKYGDGELTNKNIAENTYLGSIYIEAMPRYGYGCGILTKDRKPTEFGKLSFDHDRQFLLLPTQWLMHYHLSATHGPGPSFWNYLVKQYFVPDIRFNDEDLVSFLSLQIEGLKTEHLSQAKTIFLGTYTKSDGLANLNLLQKDEERGEYQVNYPEPPSVWVMGVALLHYWRTMFPDQKMIEMKDLVDESDFARIFMVGTRRINKMLEAMRRIGYVELFTTAPPYTVALLNDDVDPLLERMYAGDESE